MKESEMKQLPGRLEIRVSIETPRQNAEPAVYGQGVDGKPPRRDVEYGGGCANGDRQQAVTKGHPPTEIRVRDSHHLVAGTIVVRSETPAQSVEVRKLPSKEDSR